MAKIYGLNGVLSGKQGGTVFSVRNGENIARKYQPIVSNPSTNGQVQARAKLKLMSQLSAVLGEVIAIPRAGAVSPRNLFTKVNYRSANFVNGEATMPLSSIKLTRSSVALPVVQATSGQGVIAVSLSTGGTPVDIDRMVYVMLERGADSKLRVVTSRVVSTPGAQNNFEAPDFPGSNNEVYFLAYGVRDNNDRARAIYGDLEVASASTIASLITSRTLTETDITVTETRGTSVAPAPQP